MTLQASNREMEQGVPLEEDARPPDQPLEPQGIFTTHSLT